VECVSIAFPLLLLCLLDLLLLHQLFFCIRSPSPVTQEASLMSPDGARSLMKNGGPLKLRVKSSDKMTVTSWSLGSPHLEGTRPRSLMGWLRLSMGALNNSCCKKV